MVQTLRQHLKTQKHSPADCVFHINDVCLIEIYLRIPRLVEAKWKSRFIGAAGLASPVVVQRVE